MLSFKSAFSLSSFTFIKRLFSSSLLSAIGVVSPAYLRLLIFLLAILISAYASSSLAFQMETHDTVQETGIKTIPKEKKCKKAKWLSEEALHSCKEKRSERQRRQGKILNAEFQRIKRRDKKAILRDQCKEIEENNRMGKTRDLFKKITDTKGTFHAKMKCTIKDRNDMDLTEAEDKKR